MNMDFCKPLANISFERAKIISHESVYDKAALFLLKKQFLINIYKVSVTI